MPMTIIGRDDLGPGLAEGEFPLLRPFPRRLMASRARPEKQLSRGRGEDCTPSHRWSHNKPETEGAEVPPLRIYP